MNNLVNKTSTNQFLNGRDSFVYCSEALEITLRPQNPNLKKIAGLKIYGNLKNEWIYKKETKQSFSFLAWKSRTHLLFNASFLVVKGCSQFANFSFFLGEGLSSLFKHLFQLRDFLISVIQMFL